MFNHKFNTGDTVEYGNYRFKILTVIQKRDSSIWYEIEGVDDASRRKLSTISTVVPERAFDETNDQNYVLVTHCHEMATYYAGFERGYVFTDDIRKAVRFSWKELADMFADPTDLITSGVTVVRIDNVTFEKLEHDDALRKKYNDFLWVAR